MHTPRRTAPRTAQRGRQLAPLLAALLVVTGCSGDTEPTSPAEAEPTPLSAYDTTGLEVRRADPCAGLTDAQVLDALGGEPEAVVAWAPGEHLPDSPEVADEWGCRLTGSEAAAEAWVVAPPVTPGEARRLMKDLTQMKCRAGDGDTFGDPGTAFSCGLNSGATVHGYAGLFGDAWVVTSLVTDDQERAGRWAVAVLTGLEP